MCARAYKLRLRAYVTARGEQEYSYPCMHIAETPKTGHEIYPTFADRVMQVNIKISNSSSVNDNCFIIRFDMLNKKGFILKL